MPTITPFLWFEHQAEEAMHHYLSIFRNSKTISVSKAGGQVTAVTFELDGQRFIALNAGPHHKFNEAVSFFISCETQDEIDYYWTRLTAAGGSESQCGWLKDRFGVSWQVVPKVLGSLMSDPDPQKARATVDAMLAMKKLVIADLKKAHDRQDA
jgi:predicted 3-demethylubiquinone-9 3-methyltransferase (glyoxalase superfamily)